MLREIIFPYVFQEIFAFYFDKTNLLSRKLLKFYRSIHFFSDVS